MLRMPGPENMVELRSFLGMLNLMARFLQKIVEETQTLKGLFHIGVMRYRAKAQEAVLPQEDHHGMYLPVAYASPEP